MYKKALQRNGMRSIVLLLLLLMVGGVSGRENFKQQQLKHARVRVAISEKEAGVKELFAAKKLSYPPTKIFLRAFKLEEILELWVAESNKFQLLKQYKICANSGVLGPKRREGDRQVPEGFYFIDVFNPVSNFYLSMRVNYPNQSDRILGGQGRLGGDIYIHGDCVTIGCIPLTDEGIKELYIIVVEAKSQVQQQIPVHIFPAKMTADKMAQLKHYAGDNPKLWEFWLNLKEGFDFFENQHRLPAIAVNREGKYIITDKD